MYVCIKLTKKKGHLPGFKKKVLGKVRSCSFKTPVILSPPSYILGSC